ncbi:MAG: hypothetical protein CVT97_05950 [Bacteroidetes bacterium HGW-Bacteroidetes-14]|jgi:iron complex transport system substrate-binding protein|nr:MAG: hypothetical protein CVT97_05950 [Bacteroidetes bacterium HGW-Bacteroidetes-14]
MKSPYQSIFLAICLIIFSSCRNVTDSSAEAGPGEGCEYARNFSLSDSSGLVRISVSESWEDGSEGEFSQRIISPERSDSLKRIVCMSTSHIAYISALGMEERIVGVSGSRYISNSKLIKRIESGLVADIGFESSLNYELLLSLRPDVVFTYGISGENNQYIEKIRQFGIDVIPLGDYLEEHPLGKLEYLKLFGEILGCRELADSLYTSARDRYLSYREMVSETDEIPVLVNAPWKDVWYIPGEKSYMTILAKDAGAKILGSEKNETRTKSMSIEKVYSFASKARFWINPNSAASLEELKGMNPLFGNIDALKKGNVYNNTRMNTPGGGSGFWEQGVVEPDIILKDLISILHPEIFPEHTPKYYIKLK